MQNSGVGSPEPVLRKRIARLLYRGAGVRLFRFFTRKLSDRPAAPAPGGVALRTLDAAHLAPYCANPQLDLAPAKLEAAFARGDLCAGAFVAGELVGYCWFAFAPLHHLDGVWVEFDPQGVWMYKSLVLPPYRGRGIAGALYRVTDAACLQRGCTFSISCVEMHNRSSIAAKRGLYAPAGYAAYLRRNRRLLTWASPRARQFLRFYLPGEPASRPGMGFHVP